MRREGGRGALTVAAYCSLQDEFTPLICCLWLGKKMKSNINKNVNQKQEENSFHISFIEPPDRGEKTMDIKSVSFCCDSFFKSCCELLSTEPPFLSLTLSQTTRTSNKWNIDLTSLRITSLNCYSAVSLSCLHMDDVWKEKSWLLCNEPVND